MQQHELTEYSTRACITCSVVVFCSFFLSPLWISKQSPHTNDTFPEDYVPGPWRTLNTPAAITDHLWRTALVHIAKAYYIVWLTLYIIYLTWMYLGRYDMCYSAHSEVIIRNTRASLKCYRNFKSIYFP